MTTINTDEGRAAARSSEAEVQALVALPVDYAIITAADYSAAAHRLREIKTARKSIEDKRLSITRKWDALKAEVMDLFRPAAQRLDSAEAAIKAAMLVYDNEQRRIAAEHQRKLDEQARKEREKLAKQAAEAEAKGRAERAAELQERAARVVAPVVSAAPPKVEGISKRTIWKCEIVDPKRVNPLYLCPDEKKIAAQVRTLGPEAQALVGDGVRIYSEEIVSARAAP